MLYKQLGKEVTYMKSIGPKHEKCAYLLLAGKSITDTAKELEVSRSTIHRWLQTNLFKKYVNDVIVGETKNSVKKVLDAMVNEAVTNGNAQAARLILEAHNLGKGAEKVEINVNNNEVDLEKIRQELQDM